MRRREGRRHFREAVVGGFGFCFVLRWGGLRVLVLDFGAAVVGLVGWGEDEDVERGEVALIGLEVR